MIELKNVTKVYEHMGDKLTILKDISFSIKEGERVAIIGPSGSGKSTLLSLMALLDTPTSGSIFVHGKDSKMLSEEELAHIRNKTVSVIFQSFELIQFFTAYENVALPSSIRNSVQKHRINELLASVGLASKHNNMPHMLSGGEQQRVALARALASESAIIFADEPTGNLDSKTGEKVFALLLDECKRNNKALVLVTHDMNLAQQMDIIYTINDGTLERRHSL